MRQPPDLSEKKITACLRAQYGLETVSARFLPIGYDLNAFVYEARTAQDVPYFVKIRRGDIHLPGLLVPRVLIEAGIPHILAPLRTKTQELWCLLDSYSVIVYPFIQGENAKVVGLTDSQWIAFGATLGAIHSGGFASRLQGQVPAETFSLPSAALVRRLSAHIRDTEPASPAAKELTSCRQERAPLIAHLLERAEALGRQLASRRFEYVLCHADIHAANILVSDAGEIYLIDWDGPLLAPRERDLLFVVGNVIAHRTEPREEALFFQGYGTVEIDRTALAYYRYERAIEDIGETGKSVCFAADLSEEMKAAEAVLFRSLFAPGNIVESAMEADRSQGGPAF